VTRLASQAAFHRLLSEWWPHPRPVGDWWIYNFGSDDGLLGVRHDEEGYFVLFHELDEDGDPDFEYPEWVSDPGPIKVAVREAVAFMRRQLATEDKDPETFM
jgi:hypothetical protein